MIDPRELRIGNYVLYHEDGTIFKVTEIYKEGLGVEDDKEETWIEGWQFSPIPITPEWLERLGFRKVSIDYPEEYELNEFLWILPEDGNWDDEPWFDVFIRHNQRGEEYIRAYIGCNPKYVHQLQNLQFALTGAELKQGNE